MWQPLLSLNARGLGLVSLLFFEIKDDASNLTQKKELQLLIDLLQKKGLTGMTYDRYI